MQKCRIHFFFHLHVAGVRMLDGDVTDMVEAKSLSLHPQHIDIYSASWGPDDDGKTVDGPASLARQAFENGIRMVGEAGVWGLEGGGGLKTPITLVIGHQVTVNALSVNLIRIV